VTPVTVKFDESTGLAPAIVQDTATGAVLMLGYVSAETLQLTTDTGFVHFWSRSRGEVWRKGDTSGNTFAVNSLSIDCDGDAVLIEVTPAGPACHRGTTTCFDATDDEGAAQSRFPYGELGALWDVITERSRVRPDGSHTARLIEGGVDAVGRKVTEEATEVLLAAKDHAAGAAAQHLHEEVADLLYHVFVLLAERGQTPAESLKVLRERRLSH
jgi:phosphoribosyl-ATP pyrophosphohydrolase/phosphoribosyl-AMP cyclohydrolase